MAACKVKVAPTSRTSLGCSRYSLTQLYFKLEIFRIWKICLFLILWSPLYLIKGHYNKCPVFAVSAGGVSASATPGHSASAQSSAASSPSAASALSTATASRRRRAPAGVRTVQYSTVQYSTVQYSTVQYSTYSTMLFCSWRLIEEGEDTWRTKLHYWNQPVYVSVQCTLYM